MALPHAGGLGAPERDLEAPQGSLGAPQEGLEAPQGGFGALARLPVSVRVLDRLWKPDTHFFNGQKSHLHTVTTPNKLLRIHHDGRILYSMRSLRSAQCKISH